MTDMRGAAAGISPTRRSTACILYLVSPKTLGHKRVLINHLNCSNRDIVTSRKIGIIVLRAGRHLCTLHFARMHPLFQQPEVFYVDHTVVAVSVRHQLVFDINAMGGGLCARLGITTGIE